MLRTTVFAIMLAVSGTSVIAQDRVLGPLNWIPGQSRSTITLYSESWHQGASVLVVEPTANLTSAVRASSLRTSGGAWEVCDQNEYRGRCHVVDGWVLSLNRDLGLREVRSLRPVARDRSPA